LNGIFGLAARSEYPMRNREQVLTTGLELLRQLLMFAHRPILP
jgi:hypothetical protein